MLKSNECGKNYFIKHFLLIQITSAVQLPTQPCPRH